MAVFPEAFWWFGFAPFLMSTWASFWRPFCAATSSSVLPLSSPLLMWKAGPLSMSMYLRARAKRWVREERGAEEDGVQAARNTYCVP